MGTNETSENLRRIANSSLIVLLAVFLSKLLSYIYRLIIARGFGPEVFGLFSLALIVLSITGALASMGLADGLLRYVSFYRGKKEKEKIGFLVRNTVKIIILISIVAAAILFFLSGFIAVKIFNEPQLVYYIKVLSAALPFSMIAGIFLSIIRAYEKIAAYSLLVNFVHNFFKVVFLVLLFLAGFRRDAILFSYVIAYIILALVSYFFVNRSIKELHSLKKDISNNEKRKIISGLFSYSWPLVFSGILLNLFFWIDSLVIGYYNNAESVGLYGAAITLIGLFSIAQDLFMQLFIPVISKNLSLKKHHLIKELSKQIFKWIFIINLPLFIFIITFPGVMINFFFGGEYITAQSALRILAFGAIFSGFMSMFIGLVNVKGGTKKILTFFIIFSAINLILDILFVKDYGIMGVAFATACTWILFTITLFLQVKRDYGFFPVRKKAIRILIISLVPSTILYYMSESLSPSIVNLVLSGIVFVILYLGLIILTKSLDYNDMDVIKTMRDRFLPKTLTSHFRDLS